jgi:hypothetical protein
VVFLLEQSMILSAFFSFLGGTAFRMIWGELSSWLNKKQDHEHEIARLSQQEGFSAAQHARNLEAIRLQADLGVKTIEVQAEAAIGKLEADAWLEAVRGTTKTTGIRWVDAWNAVIRPLVASWSILMITLDHFTLIVLSENGWMVCSAALGLYLADRTLFKRGK